MAMNPLEVLQSHYVGKVIAPGTEGINSHIGSKILAVQLQQYESILEFVVEKDGRIEIVDVLFEWDIVVISP